jgi:hypothetical protein
MNESPNLGDKNEPANMSSHSFDTLNMGNYKGWPVTTNASFLTLFSHTYPVPPHTGSW